MLCCFLTKLPFKGLGATAGKDQAVAFDTVWGFCPLLCDRRTAGRSACLSLSRAEKKREINFGFDKIRLNLICGFCRIGVLGFSGD